MTRTVRIGNAGGYWGDDVRALRRQLEGGPLDYVSLDYLAEVTMSILQRQRAKDPSLGYATDFVDQMRDCLPLLLESGATVITNAGGVNPEGLGRKLVEVARGLGLRRMLRASIVGAGVISLASLGLGWPLHWAALTGLVIGFLTDGVGWWADRAHFRRQVVAYVHNTTYLKSM